MKKTASSAGLLKRHIKIILEGIRYPCDQCELAATSASCLKQRVENTQEGVRYPCDKCAYAATTSSALKVTKCISRVNMKELKDILVINVIMLRLNYTSSGNTWSKH